MQRKSRASIAACFTLVLTVQAMNAANIVYKNLPGELDFTVGSNWNGEVAPGVNDIPIINGVDGVVNYAYIDTTVDLQRFLLAELFGDSGGLELRSGATLTTSSTGLHYVGARGTGHLRLQNGASMSLAGPLYLGWGSGSGHGNGTVMQTGGSYTGTSMVLGHLGEVVSDAVQIGSVGTYTLDDGSINLSSSATVGNAGTGTFNMNAGTFNANSNIVVGNSGTGTFNMNGGTLVTNSNIIVGNSGTGTIHLNGGSISTGSNSNGYLQIGRTGTGTVQQTGGTMEVNRIHADPGIVIASHTGGVGTYEISGGSLTVAADNAGVLVGTPSNTSTGTFRVIGDDATIDIGTNYVQNAPSALELEIDSGISAINVVGDATLDGVLSVLFTEMPSLGQQFTIMNYGGTLTGAFSTFDNLVDSPMGADSIMLSIDYGIGSNGSIVLTVVPEPGTLALAALSMLAFVPLYKRAREKLS